MYDVQEAPTYVVRKLDLSKTLCGDSKEIVQIQCTGRRVTIFGQFCHQILS